MGSDDDSEDRGSKILARNSACHACRKRKLKCDAVKPICQNCQKHMSRHANSAKGPQIECTWDAPKPRRARVDGGGDSETAGNKKARINELESRIAAFEKALKEQRQGDGNDSMNTPSTSRQPDIAGRTVSPNQLSNGQDQYTSQIMKNTFQQDTAERYGLKQVGSSSWTTQLASQDTAQTADTFGATNEVPPFAEMIGFDLSFPSPFNSDKYQPYSEISSSKEMVWPNWPIDLPTLDVVEHMAGVFFDKVPTLPKMIHRPTFFSNLQLPPNHAKFPCRALLHAILAVAAYHVSADRLATRAYFPVGASSSDIYHPEHNFHHTDVKKHRLPFGPIHAMDANASTSPTAFARFQLWHRRKALESMNGYIDAGNKLLECVQAQIIALGIDQFNAWWTDTWLMSGIAVRLVIPLRLNESPNTPRDAMKRATLLLIDETTDPLEQAIRDRTMWMTYITERAVTMATTWPTAIPDDEITTELPTKQSIFDQGYGELRGTQTLQCSDFYSKHCHMDSFSFMIKATKLVNDVNTFLRRYVRTSHAPEKYANHPDVRTLLSRINSFRLSFPPHLRRPSQAMGGVKVDVDLLTAMMLVHIATVMIAEPLVTRQLWKSELARVALGAVRSSLSMIYDITSTSFDLTLLSPQCPHSWALCSRVLCKFIDASVAAGDKVSSEVFRAEIEVFRMALQQYGERYPAGLRHMQMVDDLLAFTSNGEGFAASYMYECSKVALLDPKYTSGTVISTASTSTPSSTTQGSEPHSFMSDANSTSCLNFLDVGISTGSPVSPKSETGNVGAMKADPAANRPHLTSGNNAQSGTDDFIAAQTANPRIDQYLRKRKLESFSAEMGYTFPASPASSAAPATQQLPPPFDPSGTQLPAQVENNPSGASLGNPAYGSGFAVPNMANANTSTNATTSNPGNIYPSPGLDLFAGLDMSSSFGVGMGLGGGFDNSTSTTAAGFGFDISSFSFDVSEFTNLFGSPPPAQ